MKSNIYKIMLKKSSSLMKEEGLETLLLAKPEKISVKDCTHIISEIRMVKDNEEIR